MNKKIPDSENKTLAEILAELPVLLDKFRQEASSIDEAIREAEGKTLH